MNPLPKVIYAMAATAALWSCGGSQISADSQAAPLPRREAFARPVIYDSVYCALPDSLPLVFEVNAATALEITRREGGIYWITQKYPAYGISVYYTLTPAAGSDATEAALERSLRRMADNSGALPQNRTEALNPNGFNHFVSVTRDLSPFPVQFVSTDGSRWVVSAAATYSGGLLPSSLDSVSPVLDALNRDIAHSLNTMAHVED